MAPQPTVNPSGALRLVPAKALLTAGGVPVDGPIRLGPPGHASIYFLDPFGNHLALATMGFSAPIDVRVPDHARLAYSWSDKQQRWGREPSVVRHHRAPASSSTRPAGTARRGRSVVSWLTLPLPPMIRSSA